MSAAQPHVCLGAIAGVHGVQGAVRIKPFTADPTSVGAYGPVFDESGSRHFDVTVTGVKDGIVLAKLSGVADRDQAAALKGMRLYVEREKLPEADEEEFYHADLIGLAAELADGSVFGKIVAVWDFGGGDSIEIERASSGGVPGGNVMVPFTRAAVPVVDLAASRVVVEPPEGLLDKVEAPE